MQTKVNQYDSNGLMHGLWVEYYPSSKTVHSEFEYKHGMLDGKYTVYYKNGSVEISGSYRKDARYGYWESYKESGAPRFKGWFNDNRFYNLWMWYNLDGVLTETEFYAN